MWKSALNNSELGGDFQQINSMFQNHEGRIGVLEGTVQEHGKPYCMPALPVRRCNWTGSPL